MNEPLQSQGRCPGCHRAGRVGHACEHCTREALHCIPERFVPERKRGMDARIGQVIERHLLVERRHPVGIDTLYHAIQIPALLEVELALAPPDREPDVHDNLFRQALALGRLGTHPNIDGLIAFGSGPAGTFLVSQSHATASTLADVVSPGGNEPLAGAAARLLLEPLAAAIVALAQSQLVHGEIRPEHVLVHQCAGYPAFVKLGGFVRIPSAGPAPMATHDFVWRAPEQIFQHEVGATTDPYAVAAIAFALLFGRPPFASDDRDTLFEAKRDPQLDLLAGLPATVPSAVVHFFEGALAFEPDLRFSGEGFQKALRAALDALDAPVHVAREPEEETARNEAARPPRFHRSERAQRADDTSDDDKVMAHRSSSTQQLTVDELAALSERRGIARMHKGEANRP